MVDPSIGPTQIPFTVTRVHAHTEAHEMIDLVNSYASFWLAVKI